MMKIIGEKTVFPCFASVTKKKKMTILQDFEEVAYHGGPGGFRPGTVLEREGDEPKYLYLILHGELMIYKKISGLYEEEEDG